MTGSWCGWRKSILAIATLGIAVVLNACGDTPTAPTPPATPPPLQTPPAVTAPTIRMITLASARAEVDQVVGVTADVQDAEKAPSALTYIWSATAGTFSGTGMSVTWKLAKGAMPTPVNVTITLTVVEPYQVLENGLLVSREHRVTRQASPLRVHDSPAEISRMTLHFLIDLFGDSRIGADACLVDFSNTCDGKADERHDIVTNRLLRRITGAEAKIQNVTLNGTWSSAEVLASCTFEDVELATNKPFASKGNCVLRTVYHDDRWWLCSSSYRDVIVLPQGAPGRSRTISGYWRDDVAR